MGDDSVNAETPKSKVADTIVSVGVIGLILVIGVFVMTFAQTDFSLYDTFCVEHGYVNATNGYVESDALGGVTVRTKCVDSHGFTSDYLTVFDKAPDWTRLELIAMIALALGIAITIGVLVDRRKKS